MVWPRSCRSISSVEQPLGARGIEAGERFVQQQQRRVVNHRPGQGQPLPHAAGKSCRQGIGVRRQTGDVQPVIGAAARDCRRRPSARPVADFRAGVRWAYRPLSWATMPIERRRATSRPTGRPNQCTSPRVGPKHRRQAVQEGRLAGPVGAGQGHGLAGGRSQVEVDQHGPAAKGLRQSAGSDGRLGFGHRLAGELRAASCGPPPMRVAFGRSAATDLSRRHVLAAGSADGPEPRHGAAHDDPTGQPHPPHHRIVDDGKPNPILPLAAVEDRVEVAAPGRVDGDFRAPLVLEKVVFLRRQQRVAARRRRPVTSNSACTTSFSGRAFWRTRTKRTSWPAQCSGFALRERCLVLLRAQ